MACNLNMLWLTEDELRLLCNQLASAYLSEKAANVCLRAELFHAKVVGYRIGYSDAIAGKQIAYEVGDAKSLVMH